MLRDHLLEQPEVLLIQFRDRAVFKVEMKFIEVGDGSFADKDLADTGRLFIIIFFLLQYLFLDGKRVGRVGQAQGFSQVIDLLI